MQRFSRLLARKVESGAFLEAQHDIKFIRIKEQVCANRDIVGTHWNINCLRHVRIVCNSCFLCLQLLEHFEGRGMSLH
jgi:hypothetical protein